MQSRSPLLDISHNITSVQALAFEPVVGYNCRIKDYGTYLQVTTFSRNVHGVPPTRGRGGDCEAVGAASPTEYRDDARRRAVTTVYDIAACNKWAWWITLTFSPEQIERHDHKACMDKCRVWLSNNVQRRAASYCGVWERHKVDTEGIHFHCLYSGALDVVDSGHRDRKGHKVYNIPAWTWGFTTAIKVYKQGAALATYLTKYMTKADEMLGGRWYWSGGNLIREPPTTWCTADYLTAVGKEYYNEAARLSIKYVNVPRGKTDERDK